MDSLTQLALGAAVGEAVLGRKGGHRAIIWGAVCGTLPDLDVFIPLGDAVSNFTYHRSASHSLFVLGALTPFIVWLILKFHPDTQSQRRGWFALVYLVFATHVLLDCFTVYGTQVFWPFFTWPMSWSSIFIVDPLYTIPLLMGVISASVLSRRTPRGHWMNNLGLCLSTCYLVWGLGAKHYVQQLTQESLSRQNINYQQLLILPTPLNTVLWRILLMEEDGYHEGFYSLLDDPREIRLTRYPSERLLLKDIQDHWPVLRLQWFTKGFYSVRQNGNWVIITDLRMGMEPDYIFSFKVAKIYNPHTVAVPNERNQMMWDWKRILWVWERIYFDTSAKRKAE